MTEFEEKVRKIVASKNLLLSEGEKKYQTSNTLNSKNEVSGIIFATDKKQVSQITKIANNNNIKIYAVSTGQNWGYGCQVPNIDNCYILNLSLLNRIAIVDKNLGIFDMEPGVTQDMMYQFLIKHNLDFIIPTTGAGPSCSFLGNALDRGYGLTPTTDHFSGIITLEAVLANGQIYKSPLAEHGSEYLSKFHRNGLGPHISNLFAQSNYGIAVNATIHLYKKHDGILCFLFAIKDPEKI